MKYKTASIMSYAVTIGIACLFLWSTFSFPAQESYEGVYKSPAYYPQLLCICIIISGIIGLIYETVVKRIQDSKPITIENLPFYCLVLFAASAATLIWQEFELFYLASFFCLGLLFFCFDKNPNRGKRLAGAAILAVGSTLFIYVCFELLLDVPL